MKIPLLFISMITSIFAFGVTGKDASVDLIVNGQLNCAIVLPDNATELQKTAAEDFKAVLKKATGETIQIVRGDASTGRKIPIIIGPSKLTKSMGFPGSDLESEQFRIVVREDAFVILAKDIPNAARPEKQSMVTAWAFAYLMDRYMGVLRLWPGELGTVVPEIENLSIPELDITEQPRLFYRSFRNESDPEINLWNAYYQSAGYRETRDVMHSFRAGKSNGDWWGRFNKDKPEMLARDPDGNVGHPKGKPSFCKICVSNPEVTDEIIRIWKEAGAPDYWDVTPNDGNCFCSCDGCQELDTKYGGVVYTKEEIWTRPDYVSLTERYVWFWNQLVRRMRQTNPNAMIGVYFYSAYRNPPKNQKLEEGIFGAIVHTMDIKFWDAWREAGATEMGLRPNWWYMGAAGPSLHLHRMGKYIEHARENGMVLINMDSLYGYWATQGIKYFLASRLTSRWDMTTEEAIQEYCACFGQASDEIRRYFDFWEKYDEKVAYNIPAGGMASVDPDGIYETLCREKYGNPLHPLQGHWRTLSSIYNPKVMKEAREILKAAHDKAGDSLTRQRIEFLEAGLDHVELCGEIIDTPDKQKAPKVKEMIAFNARMTEKFGYWGTRELFVMENWGLLGKDVNVEGM